MFYQEIREMLLEINEDAVKCRAHSIMEKPFEMVLIKFGIFCQRLKLAMIANFMKALFLTG
jgi:hypothetical protein